MVGETNIYKDRKYYHSFLSFYKDFEDKIQSTKRVMLKG